MWSAIALFDDPATVGVDDRGQVDPAFPRPQIRDVTDPHLVERAGVPLPFHRVNRVRVFVIDDRRRLPLSRADSHQSEAFHR